MVSKFVLLVIVLCVSCDQNSNADKIENILQYSFKENPYRTIKDIPLPRGYKRVTNDTASFGRWLENISLKKDKTVYQFDGSIKYNQAAKLVNYPL